MNNDLIERLVADIKPVPANALQKSILWRIAIGATLGLLLMLVLLGPRHDLAIAATGATFWIKLGYASLLLLTIVPAIFSLVRPIPSVLPWLTIILLVGALIFLATLQWIYTAPDDREALIWGTTAMVCPWLIVLLSLPVLGSLLTAMRKFAPERPSLAGLAAGLISGGSSVLIYSFHCPEAGIPFVTIWYSFGILLSGILGMIGGRLFLRW